MEEFVDVLDDAGEPTGEAVPKSEAHRLGLWHRCFHCWVCGVDGEGAYLIAQRRAPEKDTWPGRLDVSVAGHLSTGEASLEGGLRELEEELGLRPSAGDLVFLGTRRVEHEIPAGHDRELHEVFLLRDDTPPQAMRLQREEVASVLRLSLDDAAALGDGEKVPAAEHGRHGSRPVRVGLSDFVPYDDDYPRLISGTARVLLDGGRPEPIF